MTFTFLKPSGEVAFFREDAEQAEWTQEEMNLLCSFPYLTEKTITRGMVILFQDPATDDWKAYEVRQCATYEEQGYQQITAEDICISELNDCFIKSEIEFSKAKPADALKRVLSGTGWNVGTVNDTGSSYCDIGRGSVWDAVTDIQTNWNVYINSRITVTAEGITGRYLDIFPASGVWRGMRIAIDKNISDPCVTYDDSELYTALYGYGGSYSDSEGNTQEYTFKNVVWKKTDDHPAKPKGQEYLEDPEKTALYGRNGKPRINYYQNTEIEDPEILLEKTWLALKNCSEPKISITGTASDLKRLGYADEPMRLHDMVIVDILPFNTPVYKQIIQLTVNLLDPTGNTPTIGDYIPNIIYINRQTENFATDGGVGVSGGGGGGSGRTRAGKKKGEFETNILQNERNIDLNARQIDEQGNILRQAGMQIDPITGVLIYAEDNVNNIGSKFRVQSNQITTEVTQRKEGEVKLQSSITQTAREIRTLVKDTEKGLSSSIQQNANRISIVVDDKNNIKTASIVAGINGQGGSYVKIKADAINLTGYVTASQLSVQKARIDSLISGDTQVTRVNTGSVSTASISTMSMTYQGHSISTINATSRSGANIAVLGWYQ